MAIYRIWRSPSALDTAIRAKSVKVISVKLTGNDIIVETNADLTTAEQTSLVEETVLTSLCICNEKTSPSDPVVITENAAKLKEAHLFAPDGSKWKLEISNLGIIITTKLV